MSDAISHAMDDRPLVEPYATNRMRSHAYGIAQSMLCLSLTLADFCRMYPSVAQELPFFTNQARDLRSHGLWLQERSGFLPPLPQT
jgi:hypothetical protein